jgi:hypothetical protein
MPGRGTLSRRLPATLFVGLLGVMLALTLARPGARSPLRESFVLKAERGAAVSLPLEARESQKRTVVHRLTLSLPDTSVLLDHDELQMFFSSTPTRRELVQGELRVRAASCVLAVGAGELADGQPVAFRRSGACSVARFARADADLTLELRDAGSLALLAFEPVAGNAPGPIQVPPLAAGPAAFDVRGAFVDYTPARPRVVLLNAMWRGAAGTAWIWESLVVGVALACLGCFAFPTRATEESRLVSPAVLARASGAAALLAGSLGVLYSVLVPPLMGPDEPYHMLGFADLASNRALAEDTVVWMGETHLWRIRQQPTERFRSIDVGRPYVVHDDQLRATEVAMRSAVLGRFWEALAPLAGGRLAPEVLLGFRLLNALVFALVVGLATALAVVMVAEPYPQWLAFSFLLVPSLPFFAMHVSETALLCSIYVLLASAVAILFLDGPRAHWAGLSLGLATGLMLAGGRSPWPLAGLVGAVLAGRLALGSRGADPRRAALIFWCGFAGGLALLFLIQDEAYRNMTLSWGGRFTAGIPVWLRGGVESLLSRPVVTVALAAGVALVEIALRRPREWFTAQLAAAGPRLVRGSAVALSGLVLLSLAGSLLVRYPQLELEPRRALSAAERVSAVLATTATMFRLREPNFLLATSFWVGFGWLDTSPGPLFQAALVVLLAAALLLLLRHIAKHSQGRRLLWLLVLGAGGALSLVLYTLTTQVSKPLHGRYLIGWYLCLVAVVGSVLTFESRPRALAEAGPASSTGRAALLLVVTGLIHTYCLSFILARYF